MSAPSVERRHDEQRRTTGLKEKVNEVSLLPWKRYCIRRGEVPFLLDGFIAAPGDNAMRHFVDVLYGVSEANVVPLERFDELPCVVILGDMGLGKSTVLKADFERVRSECGDATHAFLHVDLRGQTERTIERRVFESDEFQRWKRGETVLTLYLDSLDECWRRLSELTEVLVTGLETATASNLRSLRLRLACRSGEWHPQLERRLDQAFSSIYHTVQSQVTVVNLVSLTEADVKIAAESRQVDPIRFLQDVRALDLEPLAGQPITLFFLLDEYRKQQGLPTSRVELYRRGCEKLCSDLHGASGASIKTTTASERMRMAQSIAAASILGNRLLLNADLEARRSESAVLEMTPFLAEHGVTRQEITDTLASALFSEAIDGIQSWRHLSYAEFLAAAELTERGVPLEILINLITLEERGRRVIPPGLEETACWLVEMNAGLLFERLVAHNPTALLRCNERWLTESRKSQLLQSLATGVKAFDAPIGHDDERTLSKLHHAGLADQLRSLCMNAAESSRVREMALQLVRSCTPRDLAPEMVSLFADASSPHRIRASAAIALLCSDLSTSAPRLREIIPPSAAIALEPELRGLYCRLLWPIYLNFAELVPLLQPAREGIFGTNESFLNVFVDLMPSEYLAEALTWICETPLALPAAAYRALLTQALERIDESEIRGLVGDIFSNAADGQNFAKSSDRWNPELSTKTRRLLWTELLARGIDVENMALHARLDEACLLRAEDVIWLVDQFLNTSSQRARASCVWALKQNFDNSSREHWDAMWRLSGIPEIDNWIDQRVAQGIPGKRPVLQQREHDAPPRPIRVQSKLDEFERGSLIAAVRSFEALLAEHFIQSAGDLRTAPGWTQISEEQRSRVLAAGLAFLLQHQPSPLDFDDQTNVSMAGLAAIHYAVTHQQIDPAALGSVKDAVWVLWFPYFLAYEDIAQVENQPGWPSVLDRAWKADPETALIHVRNFMVSKRACNRTGVLQRLPQIPTVELEQICFDYLQNTPTASAVHGVDALLRTRGSTAWPLWLDGKAQDQQPNTPLHFVANGVRFEHDQTGRETFFERMDRDSSWGLQLVRSLAVGYRWRRWLPELTAQRLYWLWRWLVTHARNAGSERAHNLLEFENEVFNELRNRHIDDAIQTIENHVHSNPDDAIWLGDVLVEMRRNRRQADWTPVATDALLSVLANPIYPPIRSSADLVRCIHIALDRFEQTLHGETASTELWNKTRVGDEQHWQPKDETELSNALKRHVQRELSYAGVRALREVEIRERLGIVPAQLTDLFVWAPPVAVEEKIEVIVEVKGTWNANLLTDLQDQLIDRYLKTHDFSDGIYAVFHFAGTGWNWPNDTRRNRSQANDSIESVRVSVDGMLARAQLHGKNVTVRVVDARLL